MTLLYHTPACVVVVIVVTTMVQATKNSEVKVIDWTTLDSPDKDFAHTIASFKEPVVVKNSVCKKWPAMKTWTPDYLAQNEGDESKFFVRKNTDGVFSWGCCLEKKMSLNNMVKAMNKKVSSPHSDGEGNTQIQPTVLAAAVDADGADVKLSNQENSNEIKDSVQQKQSKTNIDAETSTNNSATKTIEDGVLDKHEYVYLSSPLFTLSKSRRRDIKESALRVEEMKGIDADLINEQYEASFSVGSKGSITPLHHDIMHKFIVQVYGEKQFTLFPPQDWHRLYLYPKTHMRDRNVQINDIHNVDTEEFPLFTEIAERLQVVLSPGDVLYLPPLYFQQNEALTSFISIESLSPSSSHEKMNAAWDENLYLNPEMDPAELVYRASVLLSFIIRRVIGDENATHFTYEMIRSRYSRPYANTHEKIGNEKDENKTVEEQEFDVYLSDLEKSSSIFLKDFDSFETTCQKGNHEKFLPQKSLENLQDASYNIAYHFQTSDMSSGEKSLYVSNFVEDLCVQVAGHRRILPFMQECIFPHVQGISSSDDDEDKSRDNSENEGENQDHFEL